MAEEVKALFERDGKYRVCSSCRAVPAVALARHGCHGLSVLELRESAGVFVDVPADPDRLSVIEDEDRPDSYYAFYEGDLPA